jgi:hypothetical protein
VGSGKTFVFWEVFFFFFFFFFQLGLWPRGGGVLNLGSAIELELYVWGGVSWLETWIFGPCDRMGYVSVLAGFFYYVT